MARFSCFRKLLPWAQRWLLVTSFFRPLTGWNAEKMLITYRFSNSFSPQLRAKSFIKGSTETSPLEDYWMKKCWILIFAWDSWLSRNAQKVIDFHVSLFSNSHISIILGLTSSIKVLIGCFLSVERSSKWSWSCFFYRYSKSYFSKALLRCNTAWSNAVSFSS